MKKYTTPELKEINVELEDVIAVSFGSDRPGDTKVPFSELFK